MTKQYKTKRRGRSRRRAGTRSRSRTITRVKRGGMLAHTAAQSAKKAMNNYFIATVLPLLNQYENIVGQNPQPSHGMVVPFGQRYYRSFADIPMDAEMKESIKEFKKEITNPVKNVDKMKTLYEKIMKTLENEEKKQQQKENRPTPPPGQTFSHPLSASLATIVPASLRREPFGTPGFVESSNVDTPPKVSGDEKLPESIMTPSTRMSFAPRPDNPYDTTARQLSFGDGDDYETPASSPMKSPPMKSPPPVLSKSQ